MALGVLYKAEKDTMKALNIIQTGRKLFPNDNSLIIEELNYYLASGKNSDVAIDRLNLAISKEPKNHTLYFALGTLYDKSQSFDKAKEAYLKAIEVKADYFDAYYNLGAMIFNQGAEMANNAANLKTDAEYNKAKVKFDEKFKESLPYLEKAYQLNKKDQGTLVSLKQLYIRMNMTEKYNQIKTELDNLK
jgi:tetratricopeptide (TPR) repeat protein